MGCELEAYKEELGFQEEYDGYEITVSSFSAGRGA